MDTLTHLVAGAFAPLALTKAPRRKALFVFALCASQLPDADVLLGDGSPEAFLTLHRGITHSVFIVPFMALCLATIFYTYMRWKKVSDKNSSCKVNKESLATSGFLFLWIMGSLILYMHVFLDCMTMYGTQIFLPFNNVRVSFPALFIVDPVFTFTAIVLLYFSIRKQTPVHKSKMLAQLALCWFVLYPLCSLGINTLMTHNLNATKTTEGVVVLQTEPFSPFVWKYVLANDSSYTLGRFVIWSKEPPRETLTFSQPDPVLYARLKEHIPLFAYFAEFCPTLVVVEEKKIREQEQENTLFSFADVRYIPTPDGLLHSVGRTVTNFVLEAKVNEKREFAAYRFLPDSGAVDTPWVERNISSTQ